MISTLRTLFRASAAEAEDALIDANGVRLLAQHLRDAEADIQRARHAIAALTARQKAASRRIETLEGEISRREGEARSALDADEAALADEIVERLVFLEDDKIRQQDAMRDLARRISDLRANLAKAERRIAVVAADLRTARASQVSRNAQGQMAQGVTTSALERAEQMAARVSATGRSIEDEMEALSTLHTDANSDLDSRLRDAGISDPDGARKRAILSRLKPD